jgi:ABC-2 type transport system permease protein
MSAAAYTRFELLRTFRSKRFLLFSLGFPLVLYFLIAGPNRDVTDFAGTGISAPLYYMVGLIPFAALGIFVGHLLTVDAIGPVVGGTISLLALISGTWFPIGSHGVLHAIARLLPSYWLVQASRVAVDGHAWSALGWIVVVAWSVALTGLAVFVYQRDTARV